MIMIRLDFSFDSESGVNSGWHRIVFCTDIWSNAIFFINLRL